MNRAESIEMMNEIKSRIQKAAREAKVSLRGNNTDVDSFSGYSFEPYRAVALELKYDDIEDLAGSWRKALNEISFEVWDCIETGNFLPRCVSHVVRKNEKAGEVIEALANEAVYKIDEWRNFANEVIDCD